jgi:uncharacterized membrane protein
MKKRLTKTIIYRISATAVVQFVSWVICKEIKVNIIVAITDAFSTLWYYMFDWLWETRTRLRNKGRIGHISKL